MVPVERMQEILDLKDKGFSKNEVVEYLRVHKQNPPSERTVRKYYNMEKVPDNPRAKLEKDKAFAAEPFHSAIVEIIENLPKGYCLSSVYDVLEERFVESGEHPKLPGNEQTLRNYIRHLRRNGLIKEEDQSNKRTYEFVFDTPPGDQMLLDFGQLKTSDGKGEIFFLCLLLRYSRYLCVMAQDHKFNSEEACRAIYRCFFKLGGRPKTLVIDQDAVFINTETYGEVVETKTFERFLQEQDLKLWVCNKADPESKGPIENSVKFVKSNFFSARPIYSLADVQRSLPGWLERKNERIHKSTFIVPKEVFEKMERQSLRELSPSVFENSPLSFVECRLGNQAFIQYKSNKYWISSSHCFQTVFYKITESQIHIYDKDRNLIRSHYLTSERGANIQDPEDRRDNSDQWLEVVERLRGRWDCKHFQTFINGVRKENPRHIYRQLRAMENCLEEEKPSRSLVSKVLEVCCKDSNYQFSQFKVTFLHLRQEDNNQQSLLAAPELKPVNEVASHDFKCELPEKVYLNLVFIDLQPFEYIDKLLKQQQIISPRPLRFILFCASELP